MPSFQPFSPSLLERSGLNLHAVFNLDELPTALVSQLEPFVAPGSYRQLILLGHAGRQLWSALTASGLTSHDPIDDFSSLAASQWMAEAHPGHTYQRVYPGNTPISLQGLGKLAGWHHPSPMMIGLHPEWGSWFAYRVVLLADTFFAPTRQQELPSPCDACRNKPCISHCPAGALAGGNFSLDRCITFRKKIASPCRETCLARLSCPVGAAHRYSEEQLRHTYSISLRMLKERY